MAKAGMGCPMKKESAWQTIVSGNSNMMSPAMCLPLRDLVVPCQKISFTEDEDGDDDIDEILFCLKHGAIAAFPIEENEEIVRERGVYCASG